MTTPAEIEEKLKEAKKLIGAETKPVKAKYPVEYEPIRRYCHMAGSVNPLFLDPAYAKKTKYGDVICPPGAVRLLFSPVAWPPEAKKEERLPDIPMPEGFAVPLNLGNDWFFFKPVKIGEWLYLKNRLADVFIKGTSRDPQCFWTYTDQIYLNEAGEEVAIYRRTGIVFRGAEQLKKDGVTGYPR